MATLLTKLKKSINRIIQTNKISERKVIDLQQPVQSVPITTKAMSSNPRSWRGVFEKPLCDQICPWFSLGTPVSSINKTDRHDIQNVVEIMLKVALNIISHNAICKRFN